MMANTLSSNTFTWVQKYKSVNIHFYISSRANPEGYLHGYIWLRFAQNALVRPKAEIHTPKRDDERPSPFYILWYWVR